ncbi:MAG: hypothetical protein LBT88_05320 [Oscillospiraceae bacterium]|jgi:hypothetical protein|nr:hypothetical protein [Oscillospiraceae bacterium]
MNKRRIFCILSAALASALIFVLIYANAASNTVKLIPIINLPGAGGTPAEITAAYPIPAQKMKYSV